MKMDHILSFVAQEALTLDCISNKRPTTLDISSGLKLVMNFIMIHKFQWTVSVYISSASKRGSIVRAISHRKSMFVCDGRNFTVRCGIGISKSLLLAFPRASKTVKSYSSTLNHRCHLFTKCLKHNEVLWIHTIVPSWDTVESMQVFTRNGSRKVLQQL